MTRDGFRVHILLRFLFHFSPNCLSVLGCSCVVLLCTALQTVYYFIALASAAHLWVTNSRGHGMIGLVARAKKAGRRDNFEAEAGTERSNLKGAEVKEGENVRQVGGQSASLVD